MTMLELDQLKQVQESYGVLGVVISQRLSNYWERSEKYKNINSMISIKEPPIDAEAYQQMAFSDHQPAPQEPEEFLQYLVHRVMNTIGL